MTALPRLPSRVPRSLVVGVAVHLAVTTAILPAVAGPDPASDVPDRFEIPLPGTGDRARYRVDALTAPGRSDAGVVDAEWGAPVWSSTRSGAYVRARPLSLRIEADAPETGDDDPLAGGEEAVPIRRVHRTWYDADGTAVATRRTVTSFRPDRGVRAGSQEIRDGTYVNWTRMRYDASRPPCGFRTALHGTVASLDAGPVPAAGCGPDGLRAVGVEAVANVSAVRYRAPSRDIDVWYAPGVAFPVRVEGPAERVLGRLPGQGPSAFSTGERIRLQMVDRVPAEAPPTSPTGDRPTPTPPVPTAPRRPWGPVERGVEFYFPLSRAHAVLADRGGPAVSTFLDRPGAYLARGWMYRDVGPAGRERIVWQMVLADGRDTLERFVLKPEPVRTDGMTGVPTLRAGPPARVVERGDVDVPAPRPRDRYPPRSGLPDRLPVVSGDRLPDEAWHTRALASGSPAHWGVELRCAEPACRTAEAVVEVGVRRPSDDGPDVPWMVDGRVDVVGWDAQGRRRYVEQAIRVPPGPTYCWCPASDEGDEGIDAGFAVPDPSLDRARIAGLLAAVAAAVYYVLPKLKSWGVGLYSRIGDDEVLDHARRQELYEVIVDEPGIHLSELARRMEIGNALLRHHLDKLEGADLIVEDGDGTYRCFFPKRAVDRRVMEVADRLRADGARAVLTALARRPGASLTEVAEDADVTDSTVGYHLDRLDEAGLIERARDGRRLRLSLTDLGQRAVDQLELG